MNKPALYHTSGYEELAHRYATLMTLKRDGTLTQEQELEMYNVGALMTLDEYKYSMRLAASDYDEVKAYGDASGVEG